MMNDTNTTQIERIPFYIETGREVLLAWCHLPQKPTDHAVIICPPVGHEFINSYRGLRHLADGFAKAGITAFRLDYQGVGDSSGLDTDPHRIHNWLTSIEHLNDFIREHCAINHVSLFGLRMGATLASMLAEKMDIVSLLCWVPVVEGRRYIREMLALQRTGENASLDVDSISLEGGGFLITRETMDEISSLTMLKTTPSKAKHLVLFHSHDLPTPNELIQHWSSSHSDFKHSALPGYATMMELPHNSQVPFAAIDAIVEAGMQTHQNAQNVERALFLGLKKYQEGRFDCYTYGASARESMDAGGGFPIKESICHFSDEALFGIMSQPMLRDDENKPTILLLNAGAVHRVGPSRNYIYIARQLLSLGFNVMRMDFLGLGDSIHPDISRENNPYTPEALNNIHAAMQYLKDSQHGTEVILMGVCSGAYASFQAALQLEEMSIREIAPINPLTFYWKEGMSLDVPALEHHWNWNRYASNMKKQDAWIKLLKGKINIKDILVTIFSRALDKARTFNRSSLNSIKRLLGGKRLEDLNYDINKLHAQGIKMSFFFSDLDPGYKILIESTGRAAHKLIKNKVIEISFVTKANHNFSSHLGRSRLLAQITQHFSTRYK